MDYERIQRPLTQGGGFSPRKLRAMLLGVEKKRKEEEEEAAEELELDPGGSSADEFKDVGMVSSVQSQIHSHSHNVGISRARSLEEEASGFEFHKARSALMPGFSKPAPSKWDDAQKWIASPNSNKGGRGKKAVRPSAVKFVMEVVEDVDEKRADVSEIKREISEGEKAGDRNWVSDGYHPGVDSCAKSAMIVENSISHSAAVNLSRHDSSTTSQSSTTFINPPSTVRPVSMRDMGTEMTPIASQEPSRTGTPMRASTPTRSPSSSRPTTPRRGASSSVPTESANCHVAKERELSEKELQMKTRREIMMLGTQLGKTNIAAWASREGDEKNALPSFQTGPVDQLSKDVIQSHAAAWEEAEKAKYLARFKEEEIKIQVWENDQKAKSEAEMRKIEFEVERIKAHAHDKLMSKLETMRHKAEERRAAAEAKRSQQASRTAHQVDYIRKAGRIPSSFSCWGCCF